MMVAQSYVELKSGAQRHFKIPAREIKGREETTMLWTILVVLMILWLLGLIGGVGGGLIHLLLVVAVIVLIFQLLSGRRTVV
jgi:hypothetical protein